MSFLWERAIFIFVNYEWIYWCKRVGLATSLKGQSLKKKDLNMLLTNKLIVIN